VSPPASAPALPPHGDSNALEGRSFRMYDARPVSEPLRLDPTQPRTNGRVYRIPFNDVPKEYERAERLVLEGRLVEAERVLNKVLEMAQSHHKARRLLNQVSMKMNMQLKEQRKAIARSVMHEDDARADRSRFYTPSMAIEEYNFGPVRNGRETVQVPLRNEGAASPPRRLLAPWLKPEPELEYESQAREARRSRVAPPAAAQSKPGLTFRDHDGQPSPPQASKYSDGGPEWPVPPSRGKPAWGSQREDEEAVAISPGSNHGPQNLWRRPPTHAKPRHQASSDVDEESQPVRPYEPLSLKVHNGVLSASEDDDDSRPVTRSPRRADSAASSQPDHGEVDYGKMFEAKYRELKDKQKVERMRAQVIREGQLHHILNQESIISKSMDAVNNRRHKVETFASNKLNLAQQGGGPPANIRPVKIGGAQPAKKAERSQVDRELQATSKYIYRMRNAQARVPKQKGMWESVDADPRFE